MQSTKGELKKRKEQFIRNYQKAISSKAQGKCNEQEGLLLGLTRQQNSRKATTIIIITVCSIMTTFKPGSNALFVKNDSQ